MKNKKSDYLKFLLFGVIYIFFLANFYVFTLIVSFIRVAIGIFSKFPLTASVFSIFECVKIPGSFIISMTLISLWGISLKFNIDIILFIKTALAFLSI